LSAEQAKTGDGESGPSLRVIVVGASGVEQRLRRDASLELVRARSALEAVGELGDPIAEDSPRDAVVLVAPEAEPEGLDRFLAGLRVVDPGVTVLRLDRAGEGARGLDGYDGSVHARCSSEELRAAMGAAVARRRRRAVVDEGVVEPAAGLEAPRVEGDDGGDSALVEALVTGEDVLPVALAALRARTGAEGIRFVEDAGAEGGVVVGWNGRAFGALVGSGDGSGDGLELDASAAWLGRWLRLAEQHAELSEAAFTDPLTGAWNRRYFDRFLRNALVETRRRRGSLSLLVFDIDDFKGYNDEFGHAAGDEILTETVRLLRSAVRPTDRVCRIGGDEFAVVFHEPDGPREAASKHPESVGSITRRFQKLIAAHRFPKLGEAAPGTLTLSGGLATYPWDAHDAETLLERADELALASKRSGKDAITIGRGAG